MLLQDSPSNFALITQFTEPGISGPLTVNRSTGFSRRRVCHFVASETASSPSRSVSGRKSCFLCGSKAVRIDPIPVRGPMRVAARATTSDPATTIETRILRPGRGAVSTLANSAPSSILFCCLAAGISARAPTTLTTKAAANGSGDQADP